jgi:hypothetical protein
MIDFSKVWFTPVPVEYLNWGLLVLFFLAAIYQYLGYRIASFYFVSFLGLLPFRLMKANVGLGEEVANMHMGSVIFAIAIFLFVWYKIDRVLPLLFNTRIGQLIIAYTLLIGDRVTSFNKLFTDYPVFKGCLIAYFLIILVSIWSLLDFHSAFFLALSYPWLFYRNLLRHFFTDEVSESFKKENLSAELNENPLDFDWEHFVSLMSSVALAKHKFSVKNHLKFAKGSFKYPNLAKRYMGFEQPFAEAAGKVGGAVKRTFNENSTLIVGGASALGVGAGILQNWTSATEEEKALNARAQDKADADEAARRALCAVRKDKEKTLGEIKGYSRKFRDLQPNDSKIMTPIAREAEGRLNSSRWEELDTTKDYEHSLHKMTEQILEESGYEMTPELDLTSHVRSQSARFWTNIKDVFVDARKHRINPDLVIKRAKDDPQTVDAVKKALIPQGQGNLPELSDESLKAGKLVAEEKIKAHFQSVVAKQTELAIKITKHYPKVLTAEADKESLFGQADID